MVLAFADTILFFEVEQEMKRNRKAQDKLLDLYLYLDLKSGGSYRTKSTKKTLNRFNKIKDEYDNIYANRQFSECEWNEYYGLFKVNGRWCVDPKRMQKKTGCFSKKMIERMSKRNTTYFHPKKKSYTDYCVNRFVTTVRNLKKEFINVYKPIIDQSLENIKSSKRDFFPADCDLYMQGIYEHDEVNMWVFKREIEQVIYISERCDELYKNMYSQFILDMTSRIEAISVSVYASINPKMKKWSRDKLYDNINSKQISSRDLPSFKYHDKLYLIWHFLKHNNIDIYENLRENYPEVLISKKYKAGNLAKNYLKLDDKLIIELLNGVEKYFVEWCNVNCDENYNEAQWNYEDYFVKLVNDEIKMYRNPIGSEF